MRTCHLLALAFSIALWTDSASAQWIEDWFKPKDEPPPAAQGARTNVRPIAWDPKKDGDLFKLATFNSLDNSRYFRLKVEVDGLSPSTHDCGSDWLYRFLAAAGVTKISNYILSVSVATGNITLDDIPIATLRNDGRNCQSTLLGTTQKFITPYIRLESKEIPISITYKVKQWSATSIDFSDVVKLAAYGFAPWKALINGGAVAGPIDIAKTVASYNEYNSTLTNVIAKLLDQNVSASESNDILIAEQKGLAVSTTLLASDTRRSQRSGSLRIFVEPSISILSDLQPLYLKIDSQDYVIPKYTPAGEPASRRVFPYPIVSKANDPADKIFSAVGLSKAEANYGVQYNVVMTERDEAKWSEACRAAWDQFSGLTQATLPDRLVIFQELYRRSIFSSIKKGNIFDQGCGNAFPENLCAVLTPLNIKSAACRDKSDPPKA